MNSNDAIDQGFIPYPSTFPAIKFTCPEYPGEEGNTMAHRLEIIKASRIERGTCACGWIGPERARYPLVDDRKAVSDCRDHAWFHNAEAI